MIILAPLGGDARRAAVAIDYQERSPTTSTSRRSSVMADPTGARRARSTVLRLAALPIEALPSIPDESGCRSPRPPPAAPPPLRAGAHEWRCRTRHQAHAPGLPSTPLAYGEGSPPTDRSSDLELRLLRSALQRQAAPARRRLQGASPTRGGRQSARSSRPASPARTSESRILRSVQLQTKGRPTAPA